MNKLIIFCFSLFLIVSCQKDLSEDILEANQIDLRSSFVNKESTSAGDIIRDHFQNNKESDPLTLIPEDSREEFRRMLSNFTIDLNDNSEFSDILLKLRNEYGMNEAVSKELELFHKGLIMALKEDAHSVFNYYKNELQKNRKLTPLQLYQVITIIEASQALWDVTCIHIGIANDFQSMTRDERNPLCDELIDDLEIQLTHTLGVAAFGLVGGAAYGGYVAGPAGVLVGGLIGSVVGGIGGWFDGKNRLDFLYEECEKCLPPNSIDVTTEECSLTADFTPIGAGSMVTSLLWESDQTIPSSATGSRTQTQSFSHIAGSGPIKFKITAKCRHEGESILLFKDLDGGNIESQVVSVPYNAFYVVGNDAIKIPIVNGQVGGPVTETYQFSGLAIDDPDNYSYEVLGNVANGSIVSSTSNTITIRWYPSNIDEYLLSEYVWGSLRFKVTNNCSGGESKVFIFNPIIYGHEYEI